MLFKKNKSTIAEIDGGFEFMTPKERDEYWMKKYGMTFEQWQKENPPMTDEERKKDIENNLYYLDKKGKKIFPHRKN